MLDQQIVDTEGKRLVRVNDLQIARKNQIFLLTGVDVGGFGLVRRLGLDTAAKAAAKLFNKKLKSNVIPWKDVASIEHDDPLRLKVSQDRLVQMEPTDIAAILDDLDHQTSKALLEGFSDEQLADTLEESSPKFSRSSLLRSNLNARLTFWKRWTLTKPPIFWLKWMRARARNCSD